MLCFCVVLVRSDPTFYVSLILCMFSIILMSRLMFHALVRRFGLAGNVPLGASDLALASDTLLSCNSICRWSCAEDRIVDSKFLTHAVCLGGKIIINLQCFLVLSMPVCVHKLKLYILKSWLLMFAYKKNQITFPWEEGGGGHSSLLVAMPDFTDQLL